MPTYVSANRKEFRTPDEGLYLAVCKDVVKLGELETPWGKKEFVELRWDLEEINPDTNRPFEVRRRFTRTLNEKSNLYKLLILWRGRAFTAQELKQFDLDTVIGANCQLQIVHALDDDGRTWANVAAAVKAPKNLPPLTIPEDYVRVQDRPVEHQVSAPAFQAPPPVDPDPVPF